MCLCQSSHTKSASSLEPALGALLASPRALLSVSVQLDEGAALLGGIILHLLWICSRSFFAAGAAGKIFVPGNVLCPFFVGGIYYCYVPESAYTKATCTNWSLNQAVKSHFYSAPLIIRICLDMRPSRSRRNKGADIGRVLLGTDIPSAPWYNTGIYHYTVLHGILWFKRWRWPLENAKI